MKKIIKTINIAIIIAVSVFSVLLFTACEGGAKTKIVVMGSTSVQPYAELLAEEYERLYPEVKVDVTGGGSSTGISSARSGVAAIGMSSRELKDSEKTDLEEFKIATDGLALIINPKNPVADLSLEEIRKIYTGETKHWTQIAGFEDWKETVKSKETNIHVITREEGSGTRTAFQDFVMAGKQISSKAATSSSNGAIRYSVADDANAIGFISLGLVDQREAKGQKPVKALSLNGVEATEENVENGSYGLSRPFLFVTKGGPEGLAKDFIEFVLSPAGKEILAREGLVAGRGDTAG